MLSAQSVQCPPRSPFPFNRGIVMSGRLKDLSRSSGYKRTSPGVDFSLVPWNTLPNIAQPLEPTRSPPPLSSGNLSSAFQPSGRGGRSGLLRYQETVIGG